MKRRWIGLIILLAVGMSIIGVSKAATTSAVRG